jgi:protein TonB
MNILKQSNNNLDELVFEHRNKAYGAYVLRRNYNKNLKRSFLFTFLIPVVIIVISTVYNRLHGNETKIKPLDITNTVDSVIIIEVVLEKNKFVEEVQQTINKINKGAGHNQNYVVKRNKEVRSEVIDSILAKPLFEGPEGFAVSNVLPIFLNGQGGTPGNNENGNEEFSIDDIEKMPVFNGDLYEYLGNELKYPTAALTNNIGGKVMVSFVINKNGEISDIELIRKLGFGCDEEAIRVIKNMPKWSAGEQNKRKVNVKMILPIVFEVTN